jgi:hypothetical protein
VDAIGRICPVVSDLSGFERKLVRWCRICPVVSDWYVGFSVGFLSGNRRVRVHVGRNERLRRHLRAKCTFGTLVLLAVLLPRNAPLGSTRCRAGLSARLIDFRD